MYTIKKLVLAGAAATALLTMGASSYAQNQGPAMMNGGVLVARGGMTLYTFDKDAANSGKSVCNGPCAGLWPPLMATAADQASGDYSIITRDDGSRQWAYKGKPLYMYKSDQKAGDRSGDKFKDVWHVITE